MSFSLHIYLFFSQLFYCSFEGEAKICWGIHSWETLPDLKAYLTTAALPLSTEEQIVTEFNLKWQISFITEWSQLIAGEECCRMLQIISGETSLDVIQSWLLPKDRMNPYRSKKSIFFASCYVAIWFWSWNDSTQINHKVTNKILYILYNISNKISIKYLSLSHFLCLIITVSLLPLLHLRVVGAGLEPVLIHKVFSLSTAWEPAPNQRKWFASNTTSELG